ncbi:MAG: T9SS type A sorting domain-containing protein [Salinivirgaceae bacterium]|jgi:hypothetical protein|nr:T9SS type A sorting domain-containing protein [Salinivirgaceae bacterium]
MRKFTLLLAMIAFVSFSFAQKGFVPKEQTLRKADPVQKVEKKQVQEKSPGDVLWEHDFNGDLWSGTSEDGLPVPSGAPEGWALTDASGNGYYWRWDTVGPRGNFTSPGDDCHEPEDPIDSETADNGFMMLEANYYNTPFDCNGILEDAMDAAVVYEAGLDFSNNPSVHLIYMQWNRFCCGGYTEDVGAFFEVSTDGGTTWVSKHVEFGAINAGDLNDSEETKVDISAMVGGEANVQFRFRLVGESHYHWEIDDLRFVEPWLHDILAVDYWNNYIEDYDGSAETGTGYEDENDFVEGYYNYPWFMIQKFASYAFDFANNGSVDQTGVTHHVDITKNGAPFASFESEYGSLPMGAEDTTKTMGEFMPDGKGHYTISHYATADEQDQDLSNSTIERDFVVGSNILSAVDYKNRNGRCMPSNWNSHVDGRGFGTEFELPEASEHGDGTADYYIVEGLEFYLTAQESADQLALIENGEASMYAELYRFDETSEEWVLVISSDEYTLQISDTASFVYIPYATDGSSEYLTESGTYMTNLAFYGLWMDPYDREQSVYVGENTLQKVAYGATMLVPPGAPAADVSNPSGGAGACIALHMSFSDAYPETEYETTFSVTANGAAYEGATVKVAGIEVDTDADGNAGFMLEDGVYSYTVDAEILGEDTEPVEGEVTVSGAGQTIPVNLTSIFTVNTVDFNIYPNPSNGVFNVDVDGNATVTVMNVAGQVVDRRTINGSQTITLDNVNAGVYFVRVQVGEDVGTKQLIIR